jgi:hypothetical protein
MVYLHSAVRALSILRTPEAVAAGSNVTYSTINECGMHHMEGLRYMEMLLQQQQQRLLQGACGGLSGY